MVANGTMCQKGKGFGRGLFRVPFLLGFKMLPVPLVVLKPRSPQVACSFDLKRLIGGFLSTVVARCRMEDQQDWEKEILTE